MESKPASRFARGVWVAVNDAVVNVTVDFNGNAILRERQERRKNRAAGRNWR